MKNVISLDGVRKEFAEKAEQDDYKSLSESQYRTIEQLLLTVKELGEKLSHAEHLLKNVSGPVHTLKIADEELICMEQIQILRDRSRQKELNLEEVKRLDLLVKNLRLIREKSTEVINVTDYDNLAEDSLVAIARGITSEE